MSSEISQTLNRFPDVFDECESIFSKRGSSITVLLILHQLLYFLLPGVKQFNSKNGNRGTILAALEGNYTMLVVINNCCSGIFAVFRNEVVN
jgi:hypothetical protein